MDIVALGMPLLCPTNSSAAPQAAAYRALRTLRKSAKNVFGNGLWLNVVALDTMIKPPGTADKQSFVIEF